MEIYILADNRPGENLKGEWGLSFYIVHKGKGILLDGGASALFMENAEKMGLDLTQVDYGVLSHAHFDHGNGMVPFLQVNGKAPLYLQEGSAPNCYGKYWIFHKYVGLPRELFTKYADRLKYVKGLYALGDGAYLLGHSTPGLEEAGRRNHLYLKEGKHFRPDDFAHEQSLILDTPEGLVVFNSCCHGGADLILREAAAAFPGRPLRALFGGFHLYQTSPADIRKLAEKIKDTGVRALYTGHCTGEKAPRLLKETLGEKLHLFHTGETITFTS